MYNIVALIGEAGSGKDRLLQEIIAAAPHMHEIISCTSRPMRQGEAHGINYFYHTREQFGEKIFNNEMLEYSVFNDWFYGTSYESVVEDKINIGVFNPEGIRSLLLRHDCNVLVFKIETEAKVRLLRQLNREKEPNVNEIIRRYQTDLNDFNLIDFTYLPLENNNFEDLPLNVKTILSQIELTFGQGQD